MYLISDILGLRNLGGKINQILERNFSITPMTENVVHIEMRGCQKMKNKYQCWCGHKMCKVISDHKLIKRDDPGKFKNTKHDCHMNVFIFTRHIKY